MGEDGPYASILLLLLILLIDQFFYRFAAAIPQLNAKELFRKTVEENDKKSGRLMRITTHPTDFTNTMLLVVTLNHLGAGIFFFPIWQKNILAFLKWVSGVGQTPSALLSVLSGIIAMLLFLYVLLLFGMILPQKLSLRNPAKFATAWVNVAYAVILLLWPFTKAANAFAQGLTKLFGAKKTSDAGDVTDEIIHMVNEGHEQGLIQASEAEMIHNIFDFADKEAQDIMTPRSQVIVVDGKQSLEEVVAFILDES
ncbi:MAG: CNNM domain-containing protein, partial [Lachnospiraceae bacterium]|nr:CNNM domain-containing protein [Lachnospiraceae bacterium]